MVHKLKNTLKYIQILGCANLINSALILSRPGDLFSGSRGKRCLTSATVQPIPCKLSLAPAENISPASGAFCSFSKFENLFFHISAIAAVPLMLSMLEA